MILIYSNEDSPRLKYTLTLVFRYILKTEYQVCLNFDEFKKSQSAKINYSTLVDPGSISIHPAGLLFEKGISEKQITVSRWEGLPVFFQTETSADFPFDPFSMIFYLVTRYEEYTNLKNVDQHGRYMAESSLAYQNGFLDQPVVNQVALKIKEKILSRYPDIDFGTSRYRYIPTFDIDMAYSYLSKGFLRNTGGYIRSLLKLQFGQLLERTRVLLGLMPDPFNNFNYILGMLQKHHYEPILFVNLGKYGKYDKNVPFGNLRFFRLLQQLNEKAQLNIHPSYASNSNEYLLQQEIARLEHILGGDVIRSRQHFLILKLPETYRMLIKFGIIEDYSLGYASQTGFRAGTCTPFRFYDLLEEKETSLLIRPFAFMDGVLFGNKKFNRDEILAQLNHYLDVTREVEGELIGIWHNSSLAENEEVKNLFEESLSMLK